MRNLNLKILVAGGYGLDNPVTLNRPIPSIEAFAAQLGKQIAVQGHILLNGCQSEMDRIVAESTYNELKNQEFSKVEISKRMKSYVREGIEPVHEFGAVMKSVLTDWDLGGRCPNPPEIIDYADVVILIGGGLGTFKAANWARIDGTPILAFSTFGGSAEDIHSAEVSRFDELYSPNITQDEYDSVLKSLTTNWSSLAEDTINLAEKVVTSRNVFVIMSFKETDQYEGLYAAIKKVCEKYDYNAQRVDESNLQKRIIPEITRQVRQCAFVIADVSEPKPNVYFELGFSEGLGKEVVLLAKEGTILPFDIVDVPTLYWNDLSEFEEKLSKRISKIASGQGRLLPQR